MHAGTSGWPRHRGSRRAPSGGLEQLIQVRLGRRGSCLGCDDWGRKAHAARKAKRSSLRINGPPPALHRVSLQATPSPLPCSSKRERRRPRPWLPAFGPVSCRPSPNAIGRGGCPGQVVSQSPARSRSRADPQSQAKHARADDGPLRCWNQRRRPPRERAGLGEIALLQIEPSQRNQRRRMLRRDLEFFAVFAPGFRIFPLEAVKRAPKVMYLGLRPVARFQPFSELIRALEVLGRLRRIECGRPCEPDALAQFGRVVLGRWSCATTPIPSPQRVPDYRRDAAPAEQSGRATRQTCCRVSAGAQNGTWRHREARESPPSPRRPTRGLCQRVVVLAGSVVAEAEKACAGPRWRY